MAAYADISYPGMLEVILEAAKERYGLGAAGKIETPYGIPESARRKSPAEFAVEFEEEVEASSSMDSEDMTVKGVFSQILPKQYKPLRAYNFEKSAGCEAKVSCLSFSLPRFSLLMNDDCKDIFILHSVVEAYSLPRILC